MSGYGGEQNHYMGSDLAKLWQALVLLGYARLDEPPAHAYIYADAHRAPSISDSPQVPGHGFRYDDRLIHATYSYQSAKSEHMANGYANAGTVENVNEDILAKIKAIFGSAYTDTTSPLNGFAKALDEWFTLSALPPTGNRWVGAHGFGDHTTLSAAVAAASTGDRIVIADFTGGTYNESDIDFGGKRIDIMSADRQMTTLQANDTTKPAFKNVGAGSTFENLIFRDYEKTAGTKSGTIRMNAANDRVIVRACQFRDTGRILNSNAGSAASATPTVLDRVVVYGCVDTVFESHSDGYVEITNSEFQQASGAGSLKALSLGAGSSYTDRQTMRHTTVASYSGNGVEGKCEAENCLIDRQDTTGTATGFTGEKITHSMVSSDFDTPITATTNTDNVTNSNVTFASYGSPMLNLISTSPAIGMAKRDTTHAKLRTDLRGDYRQNPAHPSDVGARDHRSTSNYQSQQSPP